MTIVRSATTDDAARIGAIAQTAYTKCFIDNIAVDPARQGQGLGRRLLDHAAREARRRHLPAVELYTNAAMTENLAMYARMGFVETHRVI